MNWGGGRAGEQPGARGAPPAGPTNPKHFPLHPGHLPIAYFGSLLFGFFQFVHFNLLGFGYKDKRSCYKSGLGTAPTL